MSETKPFGNGAKFYNMTMVVAEDGRVLVLDRIKTDWPGLTFPGGRVEKGESFAASAIREIYEETGLTVSSVIPCGMVHWADKETGHRYIEFLYKENKQDSNTIFILLSCWMYCILWNKNICTRITGY